MASAQARKSRAVRCGSQLAATCNNASSKTGYALARRGQLAVTRRIAATWSALMVPATNASRVREFASSQAAVCSSARA